MKRRPITDEMLRQWILADQALYHEAREFGKGGDDEMYKAMPEFIKKNRRKLVAYVRKALEPKTPPG